MLRSTTEPSTATDARRPRAALPQGPRSAGLVLLALALASPTAARQRDATDSEEAIRSRVVELLEASEYEAARDQIDRLLLERDFANARRLLRSEQPADALIFADRALERDPRNHTASWLKAQGSLQLAEAGIARGATATLIEGSLQDALEFYEVCASDDPRANFGASRAALQLGRTEEALRWARAGRDTLHENPDMASHSALASAPEAMPHRVVAAALFRAYVEAKTAEEPRADSVELFWEAESALGDLLGRRPDSGWAWRSIAELYEWEELFDQARARLLAGLERVPGDAELLRRLARVTRRGSGREDVIETFSSFVARHPSVPLGHWLLALERFDLGLEWMAPPEGTPRYEAALFQRAEAGFRRCRELSPMDTRLCLGYEAICRGARGWCAYFGDDDLETAQREFLSMNELFENGITWSLDGRVQSGVLGLAFVGDQYNNREEKVAAGEAFELAHRYEPEEPAWANNAGFFLRDGARDLELEGRRLCRAAHAETLEPEELSELRDLAAIPEEDLGTPRERQRFAAAANERMDEARAIIERSWTAYEQAARLDANDVRTLNDAALVLVYYLHEHLDEAQHLLERAIELGEPEVREMRARVADSELVAEDAADLEGDLYDLEEALGDAHQNLGLLLWAHRGDGPAAIPYLERSVEIGPDPRPMLTNILIPIAKGTRELEEDDYFNVKRWATHCELPASAAPALSEGTADASTSTEGSDQ